MQLLYTHKTVAINLTEKKNWTRKMHYIEEFIFLVSIDFSQNRHDATKKNTNKYPVDFNALAFITLRN